MIIILLQKAIAALGETQLQDPTFILTAIDGILETAQEEYRAAIVEGKVVELIEYQDARGFVLYSDTLYQTVADQVSQANPEVHETMTAGIGELQKAFPGVDAPETAVKSPEEFTQLVEKLPDGL